MKDEYDVIVIGAGPGGEVVAGLCAGAGLETVVLELELAGGECSFWGCIPSKGLLRPGDALAAARRVPGAAEALEGGVDGGAALAWRNEITNNWDDRYQVQWIEDQGAELVRGTARLAGPRLVELSGAGDRPHRLEARRAVVIATGSDPAVPPIDGLRDIRIWDNRDATAAQQAPRRLLVLGGGAIGVEMAQAWHSLGTGEVTVIEALDRLLPTEEPFAGEQLEAAFERLGIRVVTGARMTAATREGAEGLVRATLEDGRTMIADEILVAVGRRPRTRDIGVETVGLEPGRPIEVDGYMRAGAVDGSWLYAIGDVNGRALFTHMAKYHARVAAAHIAGDGAAAPAEEQAIPRIVFTDPQVAAVGATEEQAKRRGIRVARARCELTDVAGATVTGKGIEGTVQLVVDEAREVLVGATFTGPGVGDMLHAATVAVVGEVPLARLHHAVPSFPSLSEVWLKALENYVAQKEAS
ncbi:MAG: dihydrolipoyl dehydrogenase family protein [Actinomycetota bacterium]